MTALSPSLVARFEAKISPEPNTGCWLRDSNMAGKYGLFRVSPDPTKRCEGAHRVAWMIYRGGIPEGMCVCHRCDTPACVNPDHLWLGTYFDNMRDAARKGRMNWKPGEKRNIPKGENNHKAKLTAADVLAIRASQEMGVTLAARYGVTPTHITKIRKRLWWRHI